jgi:hypothetical protein
MAKRLSLLVVAGFLILWAMPQSFGAQGGIRKVVLKGKKLTFPFEDEEGKPEKAEAVTEKRVLSRRAGR